jgi:hypothetical protein
MVPIFPFQMNNFSLATILDGSLPGSNYGFPRFLRYKPDRPLLYGIFTEIWKLIHAGFLHSIPIAASRNQTVGVNLVWNII